MNEKVIEMILSHDPEIVQLAVSLLEKDLNNLEIAKLLRKNEKFGLDGNHLYPKYNKAYIEEVWKKMFK